MQRIAKSHRPTPSGFSSFPGKSLPALVAFLALPAFATVPGDPDLVILEAIPPTVAAADDQIALPGSGFDPDPSNNLAYVFSADSWAPLEIIETNETEIRAQVGSYSQALEGEIRVCTGEGFDLPSTILQMGERSYLVEEARWFQGFDAAETSLLTLALPDAPGVSSSFAGQNVFLEVGTECLANSIGCMIILEGDKHIIPDDNPWILSAHVELKVNVLPGTRNLGRSGLIAPAALTADLAEVFRTLFQRFGLETTANGNTLSLTHPLSPINGYAQCVFP